MWQKHFKLLEPLRDASSTVDGMMMQHIKPNRGFVRCGDTTCPFRIRVNTRGEEKAHPFLAMRHAAFEEKTQCQSLQHLLNTTDRFNASSWDQFIFIFDDITMVLHLPTKLSSLWCIKVFFIIIIKIGVRASLRVPRLISRALKLTTV